jgi:hypothetical protein
MTRLSREVESIIAFMGLAQQAQSESVEGQEGAADHHVGQHGSSHRSALLAMGTVTSPGLMVTAPVHRHATGFASHR